MPPPSFIAPSSALDRRHLGKYEVLCRLSTGGMSAIYLAHQVGLAGFKKLVVLKTILPDIGGEEDFVGMFLEEARITAVFNHPNIAQVFELDTDDGQLFMAMEFVQGCTLVEMARACRQAKEAIPLGFTLTSVRDTALALHYAHNFTDARGRRQIVIHRDVAEKNIMVTYEGVTKLLDFGIAKALGRSGRTSIGMVKGTSGYMSPEQIRGEPLDPRSDIFALGVVMHECLTGLRLFHGKTPEEGMMAALREEVQPPSKWNKEVPPDLDAVVLKALQRDREKRFATALEFARAIEKAAPGLLWHPEQLGELVTRHFNDRRAETRRLLESTEFGSEVTGEVKVQSVMAKVRASVNTASSNPNSVAPPVSAPSQPPVLVPPLSSPTPAVPAQVKPSVSISAPKVSMPQEGDEMTRPGVMPGSAEPAVETRPSAQAVVSVPVTPEPTPFLATPLTPPREDVATNPARPKVLRPTTGRHTAAEPVLPPRTFDEDDDRADKTIPAAELPEEIKNLRAQFASRRANAATVQSAGVSADGSATARDKVLTDRVPDPPRPVVQGRSMTSETVSVTNKGNPSDWDDDDDDGVKTAIARPNELPGMNEVRAALAARRPPPSPVQYNAPSAPPVPTPQPTRRPSPPAHQKLPVQEPFEPTFDEPTRDDRHGADTDFDPDDGDFAPEEPPRRAGLIVLLVVLALLAVLGSLVLLDVLPLPALNAK